MSNIVSRRALVLVVGLVVSACGGNAEPPKTENSVKEEAPKKTATGPSGPVIEQELGSIDPRAVDQAFNKLLDGKLEGCHKQGRSRIEYLSGDVKVFLRVGKDGKVKYGFLDDSTIGERATEHCIMDALSEAEWPKPIGGEAEIRSSFSWSPGGERQPASWGPEKVSTALGDEGAKGAIDKCKAGVSGSFHVTAYVEPGEIDPPPAAAEDPKKPGAKKGDPKKPDAKKDPKKPDAKKGDPKKGDPKKGDAAEPEHGGRFKSIGVAPPGKEGADKVDCLIDAIKNVPLPSPGSYAAKVTFTL